MIRPTRNLLRLMSVARVLARHDALFLMEGVRVAHIAAWAASLTTRRNTEGRPGQRLARALSELGPTLIKFGQALSTRPDLLGEEVAADLSELQDRLPPFPFEQAKRIIEDEFGAPLGSLFESFDEEPVAAASIAQVHFAVTTDGAPVAVKVLRPGVEAAFRRDIDLLYWLAEMVEWAQPGWRRLRPVESVRTFEDAVNMEMDLRFEAAAACEMGDNFAGDPTFRVPSVDWRRTGRNVMTLERVGGLPVDEPETLRAHGIDPLTVSENASRAFFHMVFRDGFFHADLHPGNIFVDPNGGLIALDFGIMGRVDTDTRRYLAEMLVGFLTADYRRVAEVHFVAGYVSADRSVEAFTQASRSIAEPILGKPIADISIARLLGQLFQVTETFQMQTQPQLLMLQKSMLVAEALGRNLAPETNMWELCRPLIEEWMRDNLGPKAQAERAARAVARSAERLPAMLEHADKAAAMIGNGGLKLHPETVRQLAGNRRGLPGWLPWALVAALIGALLVK
ncbi:2-polyprenylphenol 6-hydroxylase [Roseospirillum parvum]|uniref:Ubiquinone biosynthesis protein n=1 Tax=Roseospirillum parvum TaxID=83401 RepID=A0A1G7WHW8_9PROT|nr:2-polyprenylphenol 6-hydroxylase [Roseospirillum parvum]SDG71464.1 ubiquinone biosynthesis protein [Roseospirillum parvum]